MCKSVVKTSRKLKIKTETYKRFRSMPRTASHMPSQSSSTGVKSERGVKRVLQQSVIIADSGAAWPQRQRRTFQPRYFIGRTGLLPRRVTACRRYTVLALSQLLRPTQPGHPLSVTISSSLAMHRGHLWGRNGEFCVTVGPGLLAY